MGEKTNHDGADVGPIDFEEDAIDFDDDVIDFEDDSDGSDDGLIDFDEDGIDFDEDPLDVEDITVDDKIDSASSDLSIEVDALDEELAMGDAPIELTDVTSSNASEPVVDVADAISMAGTTTASSDADDDADCIELTEVVQGDDMPSTSNLSKDESIHALAGDEGNLLDDDAHLQMLVTKVIEKRLGRDLDTLLVTALERVLDRKLACLKQRVAKDLLEKDRKGEAS